MMPSMLLLGGGVAIAALLVALLYLEFKEEGRGGDAVRSGSESTARGLRSVFSLTRAAGFGGFVVIQTVLAEVLNIGMSIFDLLGPLVSSNLLAIGIGTLGLAGVIPTDPVWYAGIMLMIFGIAISSAGAAVFERYAG